MRSGSNYFEKENRNVTWCSNIINLKIGNSDIENGLLILVRNEKKKDLLRVSLSFLCRNNNLELINLF